MKEMNLKPGDRRRLAAEQAVYRKFDSFNACSRACSAYCDNHRLDITFNEQAVAMYIRCQLNMSTKRLLILSEILGVTNIFEIDEIYTAPAHRGEGLDWVGERGSRCRDYDFRVKNY